jgi:hypothetical protein
VEEGRRCYKVQDTRKTERVWLCDLERRRQWSVTAVKEVVEVMPISAANDVWSSGHVPSSRVDRLAMRCRKLKHLHQVNGVLDAGGFSAAMRVI